MSKYILAKEKALEIIKKFPKTKSGNNFITLKNGKKCFFNIFIKKYGLNGKECKYKDSDVYRRIKLIECFEFLLKKYDVLSENNGKIIIESMFYRFVIKKHSFRKSSIRYELLSFFDK